MSTFKKQPLDVLDYDVDMSEWFSSIPGDDIDSVEIIITSLVEEEPTLVAGPLPHKPVILLGAEPVRFKIWLGGGTDYVDYKVTCIITTEQDRKKEVELKIKVRDK